MFIKFATKQTFLPHTHTPTLTISVSVCVLLCRARCWALGENFIFPVEIDKFLCVPGKWGEGGDFFSHGQLRTTRPVQSRIWSVVTDDDWMRIGLGVLWSDFLLDSSQFGEKSKREGSKRGVGRIFTPRVLQVRQIVDRLSKPDWNEMIHQVDWWRNKFQMVLIYKWTVIKIYSESKFCLFFSKPQKLVTLSNHVQDLQKA